jgi:hypothetical protein
MKRLQDVMIHSKRGYRSKTIGYLRVSLRNKYPIGYEAFEKELW